MKIPYLSIPDKPIIARTQELVPVADIIDDIVLFKNGSAALVLESTSLNFSLLSEEEQQVVIAEYAGLINSIKFHIQILVRSQRKDITSYLNYLDKFESTIKNPKLLSLMDSYQKFIQESIQKKNVLSKNFYIIIPFSQYELGVAKSIKTTIGGEEKTLPFTKAYVLKKAKTSLIPKRDHLIRQAARMQLQFRQLTSPELINLYYRIYNPDMEKKHEEVLEEFVHI